MCFYLFVWCVSVYVGEDNLEEPDFQYIPDTHHISSTVPHANQMAESLLLLQEGLESGAALAQFEVTTHEQYTYTSFLVPKKFTFPSVLTKQV